MNCPCTRTAAWLPAALAATALALAGCGREPVARNVILISLDTVRADHLGLYGYGAPTSPSLDAFAAGGTVFEQAWAASPWTLPSHASLFTGLYPTRHGVRFEKHWLRGEIPSAAQIFGEAGFETLGVANCAFLFELWGLTRGHEQYREVAPDQSAEGAAAKVTDAAIELLRASRGGRVYLFVHYFDAHSDYVSRPEVEAIFGGRPTWVDGSTKQLTAVMYGYRKFEDEQEVAALHALYDAGIRQLDDELGRLFAFLETEGWLDTSLVVVTSDHGEELLDHGSVMHGKTQYQEQLHVPLVLRGPGIPAGARVAAPVSIVDFVPTALDFARVEGPPGLDGVSLRGAWKRPDPGRTIFAEANRGPKVNSRAAVRSGRHKLVIDSATGEQALFDLEADPREQRDLAAEQPARAEALLAALEGLRRSEVADAVGPEVPEDVTERLRALGYLETDAKFNVP